MHPLYPLINVHLKVTVSFIQSNFLLQL